MTSCWSHQAPSHEHRRLLWNWCSSWAMRLSPNPQTWAPRWSQGGRSRSWFSCWAATPCRKWLLPCWATCVMRVRKIKISWRTTRCSKSWCLIGLVSGRFRCSIHVISGANPPILWQDLILDLHYFWMEKLYTILKQIISLHVFYIPIFGKISGGDALLPWCCGARSRLCHLEFDGGPWEEQRRHRAAGRGTQVGWAAEEHVGHRAGECCGGADAHHHLTGPGPDGG